MVELLAVLVILGILIALTIPGYTSVYTKVRRSTRNSKLTEISAAALKYGETVKDRIKNSGDSCNSTTVDYLIEKGYLTSEETLSDVIIDPTTNKPLDGDIKICYCLSKFDIEAFYVTKFNPNIAYHEGEYVILDKDTPTIDDIYVVTMDYNPSILVTMIQNGEDTTSYYCGGDNLYIPKTTGIDAVNCKGSKFFKKVEC